MNEARQILEKIIDDFAVEKFVRFFREKSRQFVERQEDLAHYNDDDFTNGKKLGEITFLEDDRLIVCAFAVKKPLSERSGKKAQYEQAKSLLKTIQSFSAGIFIFYDQASNFRFSLIYPESIGNKRQWNNFRRFTYFVSKDQTNRTFCTRVGEGDFSSLALIKDAFSVEKVNKEFYGHIAKFFYRLTGYNHPREMKLPSVSDDDKKMYQEFAVRLIGRAIFCWFLKHKKSPNGESLIPESILSSEAVRQNPQYYHSVLEKLFFEVLNTPLEDRKDDIFDAADEIPFLNGGLFEPHRDDFYSGEPLYNLVIPDEWFEQFFEILEQYNFTIDENSTVDADVSVDPEMLGRIFENLLAEVNPETGETARKATGSYYTPRTIVDYMVDQSLKQYLLTKTKIGEDKIAALLSYESTEVALSKSEKNSIISALDEIKIIDPACGSGAFPMGILHKMLLVLQRVDPDLKLWLKNHLAHIEDGIFKDKLLERIRNENWEYVRKLLIIQKSIYGVDIQTIAVEISKLRFFLSLIVDEKIDDTKENRGIEALPNLEFKFVAANSLIGLPPAIDRQIGFGRGEEINRLKELRDAYLRSYGKEKKNIEEEFRRTRGKVIEYTIKWGGKDALALQLASWDPFSNEACDWFDTEWMFGVEDGFDVVIANPPYVSAVEHAKSDPVTREILRQRYKLVKGSFDLYAVFLLLGDILCKSDGNYSWIVPNKFLVAEYAKNVLSHLIENGLYAAIDVSVYDVFESTGVYPIILLGNKSRKNAFAKYCVTQIADLLHGQVMITNNSLSHRYKTFKDLNVKISSGTTGYQADSVANCLSEIQAKGTIPFVVSGCIDRYLIDYQNVRYMGRKYHKAFVKKDPCIASSKWSFWMNEKVVIAGMTKEIEAFYATEPLALGVGVYAIHDFGKFSPKFLLGVLNSKFLSYYLNVEFQDKHLAGGYLAINKSTIEQLPLIDLPFEQQQPIIALVDQIIKKENSEADTSELECQINQMVYELYGLTPEEKAVVEGSFPQKP